MGKSQRRAERYHKNITVDLFLRNKSDSTDLAGPVPCFVCDLSSYGVGLILDKIYINDHHLFYAPGDNVNYCLFLEYTFDEDDKECLSIPVRPVWFNLEDKHEEAKYFKMGLEFTTTPTDSRITSLKRITTVSMKQDRGWFEKFLLRLWK